MINVRIYEPSRNHWINWLQSIAQFCAHTFSALDAWHHTHIRVCVWVRAKASSLSPHKPLSPITGLIIHSNLAPTKRRPSPYRRRAFIMILIATTTEHEPHVALVHKPSVYVWMDAADLTINDSRDTECTLCCGSLYITYIHIPPSAAAPAFCRDDSLGPPEHSHTSIVASYTREWARIYNIQRATASVHLKLLFFIFVAPEMWNSMFV